MVHYRVHYDDSLGTSPDIKGVAELVVRRKGHDVPDASLVMLRISNEGGLDIGGEHWILPISFTFDGRDVRRHRGRPPGNPSRPPTRAHRPRFAISSWCGSAGTAVTDSLRPVRRRRLLRSVASGPVT
jgi:hypothetical protein